MFKVWAMEKLKQTSAWVGVGVIVAAFFLPRSFIMLFGAILILNDDEKLKAWAAKAWSELEKNWK